MKTQDYINLYSKGDLPLSDVHCFIECLLLEREESTEANEDFEQLKLPTFGGLNYKDVFEQKELYNGHGRLEIPRMTLTDITGLIKELEYHSEESGDYLNDIFTLKLYVDDEGKYSGTIYQEITPTAKMWLSVGEVVIDE